MPRTPSFNLIEWGETALLLPALPPFAFNALRRTLPFTMRPLPVALLLGSALFSACQSHSAPAPAPEPAHREIAQWSGPYGGGDAPATRVLRTADEWNAFWRQVGRDVPRPFDATREMAVAVHSGQKRSGGYTVAIANVGPQDGRLVVEYRETSPAPDMMVTQALTAPWAIAVVTRSELPVVFRQVGGTPPARK